MKMFCPNCQWVGEEGSCIVLDTWEAILPKHLRMQEAVDVNCCPECQTPVENFTNKKTTINFFVNHPENYQAHQLSEWYAQSVTPLREGVYEVAGFIGEKLNRRIFAYWFGSSWSTASPDPNDILNNPTRWHGSWAWRGLKQKQKL